MNFEKLVENIRAKKSFLCVGLDTDINKIPKFLLDYEDPIFEFNKRIIDSTADYCVAYKPNFAFYEKEGIKGLISLKKTLDYIPKNIFTIADAKRGDIGNTASYYAQSIFDYYGFDSITVAPYMGKDSVLPFLEYKNKWTILLALTSNPSSVDFESKKLENGNYLYQEVISQSLKWSDNKNIMFVVGATKPESFAEIRKIVSDRFLLVPGIGTQGGNIEDVCRYGLHKKSISMLINSSREVIYSSIDENFDETARNKAIEIQKKMMKYI